jgi:hypothetical protein
MGLHERSQNLSNEQETGKTIMKMESMSKYMYCEFET